MEGLTEKELQIIAESQRMAKIYEEWLADQNKPAVATVPKFLYHLHTWGGFYNDEYQKVHKFLPGDFFFEKNENRLAYIKMLQGVENRLNARHLAFTCYQGYNCHIRTVAHRVITVDHKEYYTTHDFGIGYSVQTAKYFMKYKWYPGFNDYPLGEDFDYNNVQNCIEWVTGADEEPYQG